MIWQQQAQALSLINLNSSLISSIHVCCYSLLICAFIVKKVRSSCNNKTSVENFAGKIHSRKYLIVNIKKIVSWQETERSLTRNFEKRPKSKQTSWEGEGPYEWSSADDSSLSLFGTANFGYCCIFALTRHFNYAAYCQFVIFHRQKNIHQNESFFLQLFDIISQDWSLDWFYGAFVRGLPGLAPKCPKMPFYTSVDNE